VTLFNTCVFNSQRSIITFLEYSIELSNSNFLLQDKLLNNAVYIQSLTSLILKSKYKYLKFTACLMFNNSIYRKLLKHSTFNIYSGAELSHSLLDTVSVLNIIYSVTIFFDFSYCVYLKFPNI